MKIFSISLLIFIFLNHFAGAQDRNPATNIIFPPEMSISQGGKNIYNIKNPPAGNTAAVGDGISDDTQAFIDAYNYIAEQTDLVAGMSWEQMEIQDVKPPILNFFIYIPDGTYKVSKTIVYEGAIRTSRLTNTPNGYGYARDRIRSIRFVGQSKENTVIRLADNTFTDASNPQPILTYHREEIVYSWYKATNICWNLTINAGKGNPGAIGIRWWGANINEIGNIKIISEDGQGYAGLQTLIGPVNCYIKDMTIDGFDYGIKTEKCAQATNPTLEYITLQGQNIAGLSIGETSVSVRKLKVINAKKAIELKGDAAQLVMIDSELGGDGSSPNAVSIDKDGHLFARNVTTTGFSSAVVRKGVVEVPETTIGEYDAYGLKSLREGQIMETMNLPVEEHPVMPWEQDMTQWAFAGDEASLKAAMSSGKSTVVLTNDFDFSSVDIPATVKVILCFFNVVKGEFKVSEYSDDPLFFHGCSGLTARGYTARPVVFNHNEFTWYYNESGERVKIYTHTSSAAEKTVNATAWIRNIDIEWGRLPIEIGKDQVYWVLGFKNEGGMGIESYSWYVYDGGILEVLGGTHGTDLQAEIIKSEYSHVSAILNNSTDQYVNPVISETWNYATRSFSKTDMPDRKLPTNKTAKFYSFVGYDPEAIPYGNCNISLEIAKKIFNTGKDSVTFGVQSSESFTATADQDWISVSVKDDSVKVVIEENSEIDARLGTVIIEGCVKKIITIKQWGLGSNHPGIYFKNVLENVFLSTDAVGNAATSPVIEMNANWKIEEADPGFVYLLHKESGKKLASSGATSIELSSGTDFRHQWDTVVVEPGIVQLVNREYAASDNPRLVVTSNQNIILKNWGGDASRWQMIVIEAPVDSIAPTASDPSPIEVQCIEDLPSPDIAVVTDAADNITEIPTVSWIEDISDGQSCPETITRYYKVEDESENSIIVEQSITIYDDITPSASAPDTITILTTENIPEPDINLINDASDNCTETPVITWVEDVSNGQSSPETITRTYRVEDNCGNSILVEQIITIEDDDTGLQGIKPEDISVYPNPSDGKVFIKSGDHQIRRIRVYDVQGNQLRIPDDPSDDTIVVRDLEPGIYIIKIETASISHIKKILIL